MAEPPNAWFPYPAAGWSMRLPLLLLTVCRLSRLCCSCSCATAPSLGRRGSSLLLFPLFLQSPRRRDRARFGRWRLDDGDILARWLHICQYLKTEGVTPGGRMYGGRPARFLAQEWPGVCSIPLLCFNWSRRTQSEIRRRRRRRRRRRNRNLVFIFISHRRRSCQLLSPLPVSLSHRAAATIGSARNQGRVRVAPC